MPLDFGILQPVNIGGQIMAGQQEARKNELAEQQLAIRQQELGLRQQEASRLEDERRLKLANAEKRQQFLTNLSSQMEKGGHKLNRDTLSSMMNFGLQTGEDSLIKLATEGLKALDEQDQFQSEMTRLAPKPSPGAMGSGTFGVVSEPANALAPTAPSGVESPTNALTSGYTRPQIEQMLISPNARVRDTGSKLLGALPKESVEPADVATMRRLGYPLTRDGYQAFRDAQRQERMLSPEEEKQRIRIATASRAPTQPVAPTLTTIVDPTDPSKVITIDARSYKGGGLGSPGVIGIAKPSASTDKPASVSEQNAAYNIGRVLNAATEIKDVVAKDPSALAPDAAEATARSVGLEGAANAARSTNRQIVYGAQRDALDALLYLATGAAYNKEQLQGAWDSYMPAFTDDKATRTAKQNRLNRLMEDAKVRAGKAWTPKLESAMKSLTGEKSTTDKSKPSGGPKIAPPPGFTPD